MILKNNYSVFGIFSLVIVLSHFTTSCIKTDVSSQIPIDTVTIISPTPVDSTVPIPDTISYIKRLEEDFVQSNPNVTSRTRDYTFYYDNSNRVVKVGIKNYGFVLFDTATCFLYYSGNSLKPYMVITPNTNMSGFNQPLYYDTTYFYYNLSNQIIRDSSQQPGYDVDPALVIKRPQKRYYYYSRSTQSIVEWYVSISANTSIERMVRRDSMEYLSNHQIIKLKTQYYPSQNLAGNYALSESFTYTDYINPLSKLNISGTIFSLIYTSAFTEILGNGYHKAVHNSNILPYYLDFWSPKIPSSFYIGGFTSTGFLIAGQYDAFIIQVIPWVKRNAYPAQISVSASTALGDRFIYRYYYLQ